MVALALLAAGGGCRPPAQEVEAACQAAERGDLEKLKALFETNHRLVGTADTNGQTLLHL